MISEVVKAGLHIGKFANSEIMRTGTLPDATKIYPKGRQPGVIQSRCCSEHNFIVHRSAAKWMRVEDQCHLRCGIRTRFFEHPFELTMGNGNKKIACRIHTCFVLCVFSLVLCNSQLSKSRLGV